MLWTYGLQQNGEYYEGVVSSLDDRLEAHKRDCHDMVNKNIVFQIKTCRRLWEEDHWPL